MNHQNAWQRPQIKLFGGLLVFLTCWTVPRGKQSQGFNPEMALNDAEAERGSPGVVLSECLHGGKELDALLQGHRGFLLLRLQHALVFLVGLDDALTQILADPGVTPPLGHCG